MNPPATDTTKPGNSNPAAAPGSPPVQRLPPSVPDHELLRRIGGGSYGEVWVARNKLGTLRAVKVVYRSTFEDSRPFEREFKGIQKFEPISRSHEGLVDILQVGGGEECFYYVMELADDGGMKSEECRVQNDRLTPDALPRYTPRTLRHDLKQRGRLPVEECVKIGHSLASALAHLHAQGLVHRDVKPSNIIFVGGVPKLADIGLVAEVSEARSFVGTEGFIPPEGPGTPQADLYSLGKVLYEMATGKDRRDFPELPENLRDLPDQDALIELNAVLVKACASDPRLRYQSAQEIQADLTLLKGGGSVKRKRTIRQRLIAAQKVAVIILLALLVGALLWLNPFNGQKASSSEAVRLYELGRWHYAQLTDESLQKAIDYLNQAIQIDPNFVAAHVTLFEIYCWNAGAISAKDKLARSKEIAAKLMRIAPSLAETHAAVSFDKFGDGDWRGAEEEMRRAIRLNPDYGSAHGILGFYLALLGRTDEAHKELNLGQLLDPTSRIEATVAGYPFMAERNFDGAIAQFRKALSLDPNFPLAHEWIGKALEAKGDYPGAIEEFEKSELLAGDNEVTVKQRSQTLRQAYMEAGTRGYWSKALELQERLETHPDTKNSLRMDRWSLGGIQARLGEKEKALDVLEKDADAGNLDIWLKVEPCYDSLRDEPQFKVLLKKAGLEQ